MGKFIDGPNDEPQGLLGKALAGQFNGKGGLPVSWMLPQAAAPAPTAALPAPPPAAPAVGPLTIPPGIRSGADTPAAIYGTGGPRGPGGTGQFAQDGTTYNVANTGTEGVKRIDAKGKSPLFTNVDPGDAAAGLNTARSGAPALTGIDLKASNEGLARANAIRQSVLDDPNLGGGGPRGFVIPDTGAADTQQLFSKWANEALINRWASNPKTAGYAAQAFGALQNAQAHLGGIDRQGQNQLAVANVQGQNQLATAGLQGQNQLAVANAQGQNQLAAEQERGRSNVATQEAANAGHLQAQEAHNRGLIDVERSKRTADKDKIAAEAYARHMEAYAKLHDSLDPNNPDDAEFLNVYRQHILGTTKGAGQAAPQYKLPQDIPPAEKRVIGQTYQTPRGPMIWREGGWQPAA